MDAAVTPATTIDRWSGTIRSALLPTLRGYRRESLGRDLYASLILWTLLVPQALAYAQIAGVPPEYGLYTAIGGMAGYALLGPSRVLNVGPEATVGMLSAAALAPLVLADPARL